MSVINSVKLNLEICKALNVETKNLASIKLEIGSKTPTITCEYYINETENKKLEKLFKKYALVESEKAK